MSQSIEADRSSNAADAIQTAGTKSTAAIGSESPFLSSSSTKVDQAMVKKKIPNL
jgi:hypothetical protein